MKLHASFVLSSLLLATAACGPGIGKEDGDGDADGGTTEVAPLMCYTATDAYDIGEEFDTPDGCVRYACQEGGVLVPVVDQRFTVSGDLDLPTQADVDAQQCLSVVEGSLTISGPVTDLTPLAQLTRVGVDLDIVGTDAVTFDGLQTLAEIGGSLVIADNASLTAMAFQVYLSVFGDVTIQNNDALVNLAGAEFIGQCSWCASAIGVDERIDALQADRDPAQAEGDGGFEGGAEPAGDGGADQPGGGTFYGNILIADNDLLTDLYALSNLWYAWASVRFRNNASLASLSVMQLSEVQGDLEITGHPSMANTDAESFALNVYVWGTTLICGNAGGEMCP